MSAEMDDGTLTPAGRFARMEASLGRIEEKLDEVPTEADLREVEVRVDLLEKQSVAYKAVSAEKSRDIKARVALWGLGIVAFGTAVNTWVMLHSAKVIQVVAK